MQLNFYRIPTHLAKALLEQNNALFFYDTTINERAKVDVNSIQSQLDMISENQSCYFQMLVKDLSLVQDSEMVIVIAEFNRDLLLYLDRFHARQTTYQSFWREKWSPIAELALGFKNNDFLSLANLIQADLANDPQDISVFASTISECLEKVLRRDGPLSRMICFAYCCFKELGYKDRSLLFDLLGAVLFKDLGLSQNRSADVFQKNDVYYKHPYYSIFLLKKLPIELTPTCYLLISDHHEAQDGSGFPRQKNGDHYHPLCDVLKVSESLFLENSSSQEYLLAMKDLTANHVGKYNQALLVFVDTTCSYLVD